MAQTCLSQAVESVLYYEAQVCTNFQHSWTISSRVQLVLCAVVLDNALQAFFSAEQQLAWYIYKHFIFLVLKLGICCAISVQRAFCIFNLTSICLLAVSVCVIWCLSIPTRTGVIPVVVQVSVQVKLLPKGWAQHLSQHHRRMLPSITSAQNAATATLTSMFLILRP